MIVVLQSVAGCGSSVVAADVLWSDPVVEPGLQINDARGVGLTFGPDVTQVGAVLDCNLGVCCTSKQHAAACVNCSEQVSYSLPLIVMTLC